MKLRRIQALLLAAAMVVTLAACGGGSNNSASTETTTDSAPAASTEVAADAEYPEMTLTMAALDKEDTAKAHDLKIFMDLVTERSGGKITFQEYWSAQLGAATENINTIGQGIADVGTICTLYTPTQLPLAQLTYCVPFAPDDVKMASDLMVKISEKYPEFYQEFEKNNTVCLAWKGNEPYKLYSKDGFTSLADLNGKNITMGGVYYVKWFEAVGAVPVSAPAADLYQTVRNNLAVGSYVYDSIYCDFKLYEVEANCLTLGMGARNCDTIAFNKAKWDSLDDATKALLQQCATDAMDDFHVWENDQMAGWVKEMEDNGVEFATLSDEDRAAWAEKALSYEDTLESWIADATAAGYDGKAIMADYLKIGEELGYTWPFDTSKYM